MALGALLHLAGVEAMTVELGGALHEADARALAGPEIALEARDGRVRVSLLLFRMHRLQPVRLPGPALDYDEGLWRLGVVHEGAPAWLATTCDLDRAGVRIVGRWLVRYPVRAAALSFDRDGGTWRARMKAAGAELALEAVETAESPPPEPARRVLVREAGGLYEIPWREDPAPHRRAAVVRALHDSLSPKTFGAPAAWDERALVHAGRVHHCGPARRLA